MLIHCVGPPPPPPPPPIPFLFLLINLKSGYWMINPKIQDI
jgi:hypothetical protein